MTERNGRRSNNDELQREVLQVTIALTQVAYGYVASTMATMVLASAMIGASLALRECALYTIGNRSSAMDFLNQGNGWIIGITATGSLLGASRGYLNFAIYGYTQYGD